MSAEEDWSSWVGHKGEVVEGQYPVSDSAIGYLAESLEDERLADIVAAGGNTLAPRSFMTIASRVPNWVRKSYRGSRTFMQAVLLPLPTDAAVNMAVEQMYNAPLRVGDRISSQSTITAIVPKRTRLGEGFIVTEDIEHRNQRCELVGRTVNSLLRYKKEAPQEASGRPAAAGSKLPGPSAPQQSDFPAIILPITMTRLATGAAAVRDFSPLHHDIEFARNAGHPTAFLSYSYQLAVLCRALGEWFNGDDRVLQLKVSMKASIYLGKMLTCSGRRVRDAGEGTDCETIELALATEDGLCTVATARVSTAE